MSNCIKLNRHEKFDSAESEINVYFSYYPGSAPDHYGPAPHPGDDPEINILKIETEYGNDIISQISEEELDGIKLHLHEEYEDTTADDMADYHYDLSREEIND